MRRSFRAAATAVAGLATTLTAGQLATANTTAAAGFTFCDYVVSVDQAPVHKNYDPASPILTRLTIGRVVNLNQATYAGYHPASIPEIFSYGWIHDSQVRVISGSCKTY